MPYEANFPLNGMYWQRGDVFLGYLKMDNSVIGLQKVAESVEKQHNVTAPQSAVYCLRACLLYLDDIIPKMLGWS